MVWEAWTDIGDVGAGRRSDLTRNETIRQISTSLGWTPPSAWFQRPSDEPAVPRGPHRRRKLDAKNDADADAESTEPFLRAAVAITTK